MNKYSKREHMSMLGMLLRNNIQLWFDNGYSKEEVERINVEVSCEYPILVDNIMKAFDWQRGGMSE